MQKLALALLVAVVASAAALVPLAGSAVACQGHKAGKTAKMHKKQKPAAQS